MCEAFRASATVEAWLQGHPEVELVSRDRGKEFLKAASRGAPQARQGVDRFHLVRNLAEVLQKILAHCRAEIGPHDADQLAPPKASEDPARPLPTPAVWQQRTPPHIAVAYQARQASRDDRFRQRRALRAQGLTQVALAERVGMSEKAVRTWLKQGRAPTWKRQSRRRSEFDPYAAYVFQRWQEGVHQAKALYEEIRATSAFLAQGASSSASCRPLETTQARSRWLLPPWPTASPRIPRPGCSSAIPSS
jgi:transposase